MVETHRRKHPKVNWPSFRGISSLVGTSKLGATIYYDPTLGSEGLDNAQALLADADRIIGLNNSFFNSPSGRVNVIIFALSGATDGTGGADHMGCDFQTGGNIEVCASFGEPARVGALFEAELSECSMNGQLCGLSTGEALSRWCASLVSNDALSDFATAPTWYQDGTPDFVTQTDPTDQNPDSTGCGMAFISWLLSKGRNFPDIAQKMVSLGDSGTLSQLYEGDALTDFMAAVNALPSIDTDDPFGTASAPTTFKSKRLLPP